MKKKSLKKAGSLLLAVSMVWGSLSGIAYAKENPKLELGVRPENGVTKDQPFRAGTGGSQNFRIPCMVTLDDGTIVTACDARWNHAGDACGLDTIVSYSKDNGDTWNYTFANYFGDNGNRFHIQSTAFIDPAITTDGENVYMIADLYPAGIAINTTPDSHRPKVGHTGFNDKNQLVLAKSTDSVNGSSPSDERIKETFDYYLEKNTDPKSESYYLLKNKEDQIVEGYTIDAYFNIKGKGIDTNLFYSDSPYFPWPTDYLYMTKSADAGATWSEPMLLNLKKSTEQTLLVGPGRGITASTGRVLFTAYEYTNGDKNSVCIYSDDGGVTWKRGESVKGWSSEAVVTEANGRLYMFTRHGRAYYVSDDMGETWSDSKSTGLSYNENCQLSAITYSKKIDGKTAILFSAPSSTSSRSAGKIYVALVEEDGTLNWAYNYSINGNDYFAYSCLSELKNGDVGLLYESDGSKITYRNLDIREIAKGAAVGNIWCTDENGKGVSELVMNSGQTISLNVNGITDDADVQIMISDPDIITSDYAQGELTLSSKKTNGMDRVLITIKSPQGYTDIQVIVTDTKNYKVVDLRVGDQIQFKDETGNYSNDKIVGFDQSVTEISLRGEDPELPDPNEPEELAVEVTNGEKQPVSACEFQFSKQNDGTYHIAGMTSKEEQVYVNLQSAGDKPTKAKPSSISLIKDENKDTFKLKDTAADRHLHFWGEPDKLYFDRCKNPCTNGNDSFVLLKKNGSTQKNSSIKGYTKIADVAQINETDRLLIARETDQAYYIMNPSSSNDRQAYVARITDEIFEKPVQKGWTEILFSAVGEGETDVTIGNTTYYIFVKNDVKSLSMKIGDSQLFPGEYLNLSDAESLFKVEKAENLPPYNEISKLKEGVYLFGQGSSIMLSEESGAGGNEKGLGMQSFDLTSKDCTQHLWTVESHDEGYYMKSSNGKYVNINGANVELKDTPQKLVITEKENHKFSVSDGKGHYLNNWAGANNKVAAYPSDNNSWSFYEPSVNYKLTATAPGEFTLIGKEGKNYSISVICEHIFGEWKVTKEPTTTTPGEKERVCNRCGLKETEILPVIEQTDKEEGEQEQGQNQPGQDKPGQEKPEKDPISNNKHETDQNNVTEEDRAIQTGDSANGILLMFALLFGSSSILIKKVKK